jgi:hypothetical protein
MKPTEAVTLARIVRGYCPQQAIDEYTADAYIEVLGDLPFGDCTDAVRLLGRSQSFISAAEIYQEVRKVRNKRIAEAGDLTPPRGMTDAEERAWIGEARCRIGNGETVDVDYGELKPRHLPDLRQILPRTDDPA